LQDLMQHDAVEEAAEAKPQKDGSGKESAAVRWVA
jgi:hypothetical protein